MLMLFSLRNRCLTRCVASSNLINKFHSKIGLKNTPKMQQQHIQLRSDKQQKGIKKTVPGQVMLQALGVGGVGGAPSSVYLFTDTSRYLFNCGEGTQRLAHEHKTKLPRLEQIFLTRNTWSRIGGLPGLALTVQDAGVKELALHGPPYLDSILHSMKRFVVLKNLRVKTCDCTQNHDFEDAVMSVKSVPLISDIKPSNTEYDDKNEFSNKVVIAYICKLKPRSGSLNLEKCVARGVPPGPLLGLLKSGIDVTLENGTLILSKDVSEPNEKPISFIFLDIPDESYLSALRANSTLFCNDSTKHEISVVVHFTPVRILQHNTYKNLIENFSSNTQHIYLNKQNECFSGYIAAHRIQYQLNQLNPSVFPLLGESQLLCNGQSLTNNLKKTKLTESDVIADKNEENTEFRKQNLTSMTNFHLRPHKGFDQSSDAKLNPSEYINETQAIENFPTILEKLKGAYENLNENRRNSSFPKVIFLGTGSCIPNKTRNVSSILIQTLENAYVLLDCGEGTLGQIIRFFGKEKAEEVMRNLKLIYISHLHADHHIGLIDLLNMRKSLLSDGKSNEISNKKLLLLAPKQIQSWLQFYNERIEEIFDAFELIGNNEMLSKPLKLIENRSDIGIESIATCLVRHCPHSYGVSLTLQQSSTTIESSSDKPIKITYSGDTMPCNDLIELGRKSTILIHEATMEDDLIEEAKIKMHSTITQAIEQGREMEAEYIVLTHFSQRYAKLPRFQNNTEENEKESESMENVAIAFDNMQVTLQDLKHFHLLYPALKVLFAEHAEELEQRALKRGYKLERKRKLLNAD